MVKHSSRTRFVSVSVLATWSVSIALAAIMTSVTVFVSQTGIFAGQAPGSGRTAQVDTCPLAGHWPFDSKEGDVVPALAGPDGSAGSAVTVSPDQPLVIPKGKSYSFDGESSVFVPDAATADAFTLSVWVKPQPNGKMWNTFMNFPIAEPGGQSPWTNWLGINTEDPAHPRLEFWKGVIANKDLQYGKWTHVAVSAGPGGSKLYQDGELVATGLTPVSSARGLEIGCTPYLVNDASQQYFWCFKGAMDEVRVYHAALDAAAIAALSNGGEPVCTNEVAVSVLSDAPAIPRELCNIPAIRVVRATARDEGGGPWSWFTNLFSFGSTKQVSPKKTPGQEDRAADHILAKFKDNLSPACIRKTMVQAGWTMRTTNAQTKVAEVTFPADVTPEEAVEALKASGAVEYAETDVVLHGAYIPNDPLFPQQWPHAMIQTAAAWDAATTKGAGVVIAIADSGVDLQNPELAPNLTTGKNFLTPAATVQDTYGHGTAVAGVASAVGDNSQLLAGVAYNAKIMPLVVAYPCATYGMCALASTVADSLYYAADHDAKIFNASFAPVPLEFSRTLFDAITYARLKGVLIVSAAGNTGTDLGLPALPGVVAVSATGPNDQITDFSSFGNHVKLSAPGANQTLLKLGGGTMQAFGTSFAAPQVAGVAALVWSACPSLQVGDVEQILFTSAKDLGASGLDPKYGHGRIDAEKAMRVMAMQFPQCAVSPPLPPGCRPDDQACGGNGGGGGPVAPVLPMPTFCSGGAECYLMGGTRPNGTQCPTAAPAICPGTNSSPQQTGESCIEGGCEGRCFNRCEAGPRPPAPPSPPVQPGPGGNPDPVNPVCLNTGNRCSPGGTPTCCGGPSACQNNVFDGQFYCVAPVPAGPGAGIPAAPAEPARPSICPQVLDHCTGQLNGCIDLIGSACGISHSVDGIIQEWCAQPVGPNGPDFSDAAVSQNPRCQSILQQCGRQYRVCYEMAYGSCTQPEIASAFQSWCAGR